MRAVAPLLTTPLFFVPAALVLLAGCNKDKNSKEETETPGITEPEEAPHDVGSWLSMKATPDGKPAIAYYDRTEDALGFAIGTVSGSDVTWAKEKVDSFRDAEGLNPGDAGKYASMAIAADGTVWIAYQDTSNGTLKYAKRDPSSAAWTTGLADVGGGRATDAGYWASIALAPGDAPVIAHYDKTEGALRVARWNGTAFAGSVAYQGEDTTDTAGTVDGNAGEYAKLLITADGHEYLAFYDHAAGALLLATGTGGSYAVETVDNSGDVGAWPDLALDGGTLHIAYQDLTNQDLKLASGSPGSFSVQTLDSGDYVGADAAIYVDGGTVGAFYFDGVANDVKRGSLGGSWSGAKLAGDDAALGYHNETVSIGGTRYVACYDYTHRTVWFSSAS